MRCRKRHVQVELVFDRRGGRRKGAGRKRRGRRNVPHVKRPTLSRRHPVHVTLRVLDSVGHLRRRTAFREIRAAMLVAGRRQGFRIVHLSIQGNHIHLICEAENQLVLGRGIQSLKTSAARRLNRALGHRGAVFSDRYHEEVITTPSQARNAMCYVLNNWRKHKEDRGIAWRVDAFSTGMFYRGWAEPDIPKVLAIPEGVELLPSSPAETWLLAEGLARMKAISLFEVPGGREAALSAMTKWTGCGQRSRRVTALRVFE